MFEYNCKCVTLKCVSVVSSQDGNDVNSRLNLTTEEGEDVLLTGPCLLNKVILCLSVVITPAPFQFRLQRKGTCLSAVLEFCSPARVTASSIRRASLAPTATRPWCLCGAPSLSSSQWVWQEYSCLNVRNNQTNFQGNSGLWFTVWDLDFCTVKVSSSSESDSVSC